MKKLTSLLLFTLAVGIPFTANAAAYKVAEVKNGGSVSGKVTFSGKDPAPVIFAITKDNDVCGKGDRTIDFVKVNKGTLNDVVVFLDKVKSGKAFSNGTGKLNQSGCKFDPFMQVMHNNSNLEVVNSDPVLHNIHTYELIGRAKKTVLNISQPDKGSINKKIKLRRGTAMKIECDAHDFMHGFVFVAKNPYYVVVKSDGTFKIDNIPPGKYNIKAWHGTLGEQKGKVEISANGKASIDFKFKGK
jgi:hypothetical protein